MTQIQRRKCRNTELLREHRQAVLRRREIERKIAEIKARIRETKA